MLLRARMRTWVLAALLISPAATANPIIVGANLGITQSEVNASADPDHAVGLYGRVALARRFGAQLELGRIDGADPNMQTRTVNGLAVLDLGAGPLVPMLVAGLGVDHASEYGGDIAAHHVEAGAGVEYRTRDGLVIGADVRIGDRTIDSDSRLVPLACCTLYTPEQPLADGQYRSARVTLGVRF